MKTALNRQQLLAFAAVGVVGLFLADKLFIQPLTASWKNRAVEIAKLQKSIAQGRALIERERSIRDRWADMRKNAMPPDTSRAEQQLLQSFYEWSKNSRITVSSTKPQWKRGGGDDFSLLECRVEASGSLGALARFLYEVERSSAALKVESLEVTARDTGGAQLALGLLVSGLRLAPLEGK